MINKCITEIVIRQIYIRWESHLPHINGKLCVCLFKINIKESKTNIKEKNLPICDWNILQIAAHVYCVYNLKSIYKQWICTNVLCHIKFIVFIHPRPNLCLVYDDDDNITIIKNSHARFKCKLTYIFVDGKTKQVYFICVCISYYETNRRCLCKPITAGLIFALGVGKFCSIPIDIEV